jgi:hypothetical protein
LPQSAIVDSRGFAAPAKAIFTNFLRNLFGFQSSRRAESISVNRFVRPSAGFRTRNPGSSAKGDQAMLDSVFQRAISGAGLNKKGRSRMQDALMLLFTVIFFAVAFLYVKACQKLR